MANEREIAGFERVYGEHCLPIRNFLRVYLRDEDVADDLTQETFLQILA